MSLASGGGKLNPMDEAFLYRAAGILDITVYREFRPRHDDIEVTVYFRKEQEGTKYRIDYTESREVLGLIPGEASSWYMMGRLVEAVNQELYRDAENYIS